MRVVGRQKQYDITFNASAESLMRGARWNDAMQKAFGAGQPGVFPKGVYCYRSHDEADSAWMSALVDRMATLAIARHHG
jgi:hypothetical protein